MGYLAIIWHSRTGTSRALAEAVEAGARRAEHDLDEEGHTAIAVRRIAADRVEAEDLLAASGYVFVAPENLGSLSGVMKDMFDRTYYPLLGRVEGRVFASVIAAGSDGTGAQAQMERIATGWRLRRVFEPMIVLTHAQSSSAILAAKHVHQAALDRAFVLGQTVGQGLAMGVF